MGTQDSVKTVLIPAAGLGTRMLPATKAFPKELLPIVDRPIIQYGVEEAANAGIDNVVLITNPGNTLAESHFARNQVLEHTLSEPVRDGVVRVTDLVEKPQPEEAPSNLAIIGRYILTADVFGALESTGIGAGGEIQLTDGLRRLLANRPIHACILNGTRHDAGNKVGFLRATLHFALKRPDLASAIRATLAKLSDDGALEPNDRTNS